MFKLEQEEYEREKINWTYVDFGVDSQAANCGCRSGIGR